MVTTFIHCRNWPHTALLLVNPHTCWNEIWLYLQVFHGIRTSNYHILFNKNCTVQASISSPIGMYYSKKLTKKPITDKDQYNIAMAFFLEDGRHNEFISWIRFWLKITAATRDPRTNQRRQVSWVDARCSSSWRYYSCWTDFGAGS
jgi:hypothetical protein